MGVKNLCDSTKTLRYGRRNEHEAAVGMMVWHSSSHYKKTERASSVNSGAQVTIDVLVILPYPFLPES
jgi:hypothetical protein